MGMQGDFFQLLKEQGYQFGAARRRRAMDRSSRMPRRFWRSSIAMVSLVAGDRRATAGNMVMYDRTDKVLGDRSAQCDGDCRSAGDGL